MSFIPLMKPDINDHDIAEVVAVLKSGMLVQGKYVLELEKNIAKRINVKHAIAVSNGTSTLHLALKVLGIGEGDEVIVPAFSYVATANVVELVGAKPVFVDVLPDTFNIDVNQVKAKITNKTKAIIPVHEFGLLCEIEELIRIANDHNIPVIEDAACALGASYKGKSAGSFGLMASFSLHPRKAITSGEGGILVTNNDELAHNIRILRNHGIDTSSGKMDFVAPGFNYRMTDFQAALVNSQLKRLDSIISEKQNISNIYHQSLSEINHIKVPSVPEEYVHTWQTYHLLLETDQRDNVILKLLQSGIGTNYGAQCIPAVTFYRKKYNLECKKMFPNALNAYICGLAIPMYSTLTADEIVKIITELKLIF